MRIWMLLLILAFPIELFADSPAVEFDQDADFSKYMRYTWKPGTSAARPEVNQFIIGAVDRELQFKGRTPVTKEANFYVSYHGSSEKDLSVQSFGYTYGELGGGKIQVVPLRVGTLVIDLIDAVSGKTVWRGTAVGALPASGNAETIIRSKVSEIFKKFPPKKAE